MSGGSRRAHRRPWAHEAGGSMRQGVCLGIMLHARMTEWASLRARRRPRRTPAAARLRPSCRRPSRLPAAACSRCPAVGRGTCRPPPACVPPARYANCRAIRQSRQAGCYRTTRPTTEVRRRRAVRQPRRCGAVRRASRGKRSAATRCRRTTRSWHIQCDAAMQCFQATTYWRNQ